MTKLVRGIAAVPGVHVTAYADDVTIWTEAGDHPTTEAAVHSIQRALDAFTKLLYPTGMEISAATTQYFTVRGTPAVEERVSLTMANASSIFNASQMWPIRLSKALSYRPFILFPVGSPSRLLYG